MALSSNQRMVVERIRKAKSLEVTSDDGDCGLIVKVTGSTASHEIAIAIQKYFNEQNEKQNGRL